MAKEIERKFLVRKEILTPLLEKGDFRKREIEQFYLVSTKDTSVRIRLERGENHAVLTVKHGGDLMSTNEFEFRISPDDFMEKYEERVGKVIEKTRHLVPHQGRTWEVDVFGGEHEGLIVAELEGDDVADVTEFPHWIGSEVTNNPLFKNAVMAMTDEDRKAAGFVGTAKVQAFFLDLMEEPENEKKRKPA